MAEFKLDRLKFRWRGNWSPTIEYRKDDVIYYQGKSYVCLQAHTASDNFYTDRDPGTAETITVRVATDPLNAQAQGVFTFDNEVTPTLNLLQGRTYTFDQSDNSNTTFNDSINIFKLSSTKDGKWNGGDVYSIGVTYELDSVEVTEEAYETGFADATLRQLKIVVSADSPLKTYYYSHNNQNMGSFNQTRYGSYWELMLDGYVWRGDWANSTRYSEDEIVKYRGYTYQCTAEHTSSDAGTFESELSNWQLIKKGYNWLNTWNFNTDYKLGDVVRYNGITYICNTVHTSANVTLGLENDQTKWTTINRSDTWKGDWAVEIRYKQDDVVKYGGRLYRCASGHTSADNLTDGLEANLSDWSVVNDGVEYKGDWSGATRYKIGDVVKNDASLYICILGHTSSETALRVDEPTSWLLFIPGLDYESRWNESTEYQKGDIVTHGGYIYTALTNNVGSTPGAAGIAQDTGDWELTITGYRHLGDWTNSVQYRTGDLVRYSGYLYQATADVTVTSPIDGPGSWQIIVPGRQFRDAWADNTTYYLGDIVTFAGTTYECILEHISTASDSRPDLDVLQDDQNYWKYSIKGADGNKLTNFGDIKTYNEESTRLPIGTSGQALKVTSDSVLSWGDFEKVDDVYYVSTDGADVATAGTQASQPFRTVAYACNHVLNNPSTKNILKLRNGEYQNAYTAIDRAIALLQSGDTLDDAPNLRALLQSQNLNTEGYTYADIVRDSTLSADDAEYFATYKMNPDDAPTQDITDAINQLINALKDNIDDYVGEYVDFGGTQYFVTESVNRNVTIFIKSGVYKEDLPISVPQNVALVGDELRSTRIEPAAGNETNNMFYVRNGSGIRNMTLQGLSGELGAPNANLTRRPTAGAYVSLDPGIGPNDENVWITNKSPYVQNVSTFGTGCIGMKVDGDLHNGGNKSIVANDFTQILSDGIGYWADNVGRSELVSVFTYYNHIGYLCTNGGILRATNGNNSYGEYGSVAEGYNQNETPITAKIDNRTEEAQLGRIFTYGTTEQKLLAASFTNAGENYSSANITFSGAGIRAKSQIDEIRDGAISNVRVLPKGDSSIPGGFDYTFVSNSAQSGNSEGTIFLANADTGTAEEYIGQRIVIASGLGVGQYGEITAYEPASKRVTVSRESDGALGWDHFFPGYPIEPLLNTTSTYNIEPKVTFTEPDFEAQNVNAPATADWEFITYANSVWLAVARDGSVARSADGSTWTSHTVTSDPCDISGLVHDGTQFIVSFLSYNGSATNRVAYSTSGTSWTVVTGSVTDNWNSIASINGKTSILARSGAYMYGDSDDMSSWDGWSSTAPQNPLVNGSQDGRDWSYVGTLDNKLWVDPNQVLLALSFAEFSSGELEDFLNEELQSGYNRYDINQNGSYDYNSGDTGIFGRWITAQTSTNPNASMTANRFARCEQILIDLVNRKLQDDSLFQDSHYGNQTFYTGILIAFDAADGYYAWSVDGQRWLVWDYKNSEVISNPRRAPAFNYTSGVYGANKLVMIGQASEDSAFGFVPTVVTTDGHEYETGYIEIGDFTNVSYGNGTFLATGNTNFAAKSHSGLVWRTYGDDSSNYALSDLRNWKASAYDGENFVVVASGTQNWDRVSTGTRAIGRAKIDTSRITEIEIFEPGSGYTDGDTFVEVYDNSNTSLALFDCNVRDGVIGPPTFIGRGEGWTTVTGEITGDGYAEIFQTGTSLHVKELSRLPGPGANLRIDGIDNRLYFVSKINESTLDNGLYTASLLISPSIQAEESPEHETDTTLREQYSQIRLTGHDFLDIGTGNVSSTRYPTLYLEGENPENDPKPFNETIAYDGGRVFYTSTDQDGNFKVGDLFEVEQARGIVTINATQFNLTGLTELSLGGIQVGASAVVIREFSKETTFIANSDNIVPTEKAIKTYIESRISGGGSNATTNTLVAGQVRINLNTIDSTAEAYVKIKSPVLIKGGIDGNLLALQYMNMGGSGFTDDS